MRGIKNKEVALSTLRSANWVHSVYNCGMVTDRDWPWNAAGVTPCGCYPPITEQQVWLYIWRVRVDLCVCVWGANWPITTVEIQTAVARKSLDPILGEVSDDVRMLDMGSPRG